MTVTERMIENVRALCAIDREHIGKIETQVLGVSPGYFSRNPKNLKTQHVVALADYFCVSIDDLTKCDFWDVYRFNNANIELAEAVKRAKRVMHDEAIRTIVNEVIEAEEEETNDHH